MTAELLFDQICEYIRGAKRGVMFGAPCLKTPNGKAAACLYKGNLVFKPGKLKETEILALDGTGPFDPMGGRPMGGWVQAGMDYKDKWMQWVQDSVDYVATIPADKPSPKKKKQ